MKRSWQMRLLRLLGWAQFFTIIAVTIAEKIHDRLAMWFSQLVPWFNTRVRWRIQEYVHLRLRRFGLKWLL